MADLLLTEDTHDLDVRAYDLGFAEGTQLVVQRIKQRLWFFLGEWFLNIREGVPYYQQILVKRPQLPTVESIFKRTILQTPGVVQLMQFSLEYENDIRRLRVDFRVNTVYGVSSGRIDI